jgi:hypothetical protein
VVIAHNHNPISDNRKGAVVLDATNPFCKALQGLDAVNSPGIKIVSARNRNEITLNGSELD